MKRTYETMVLLDNREVRQGWDTIKDSVTALFSKHEAEVVSARRWEERRLAYPIKGQLRGTYLIVYHNSPTTSIEAINRDLHYSEQVLRHMTTVCEDVPEEAYQPEAEFDVAAIPADDTPPADTSDSMDDDAPAGRSGRDRPAKPRVAVVEAAADDDVSLDDDDFDGDKE